MSMANYQQLVNPFEDPAVRAAATGGTQPEFDYNPFDSSRNPVSAAPPEPQAPSGGNSQSSKQKPIADSKSDAAPNSGSAPPQTSITIDSGSSQSSGPRVTTDELDRRQKELDAKAAEIERRERELVKQTGSTRQQNWPPFPSWFCIRPCFFQDFDVDIAPDYRLTVKFGYGLWLGHVATYLLNVIGGMCYFFGASLSEQAGTTFGLCILFAVLFIPASLLCWYRPLYKAFRDDSSISFFIFFLIMFAQVATCVIWAIGIPGWGSAGIISGLTTITNNLGCGIVIIICGASWSVLAVLDMILLIRVHRLYRTTGASLERAREELARSANKHAGRNIAQAAFGTFSQQSSSSSGSSR